MSTTETAPALPTWAEMSDLDKGAALLHLHKREWEGSDYAIENYPAEYFEHPALTALSERDACRHAVSVENDADLAGALGGGEYERLYELALAADRARWDAKHKAEAAASSEAASRMVNEGITGIGWDNLGHGGAA